jgi:uncharacterized oxidoreductase
MIRVQAAAVRRLVGAIFEAAGCDAEEAGRIAHYLARANLTGHDSHGVIRVPRYVDYLLQGLVVAGRHVETVLDAGPILVLDGGHGFGQTIGPEACALGCRRAKGLGAAVVALRASSHLGRIGDFAELAIAEGVVSLHFVNVYSSLLVAPYGGRERRFSTNPVAIGVPIEGGRHFVLDMATSLVAEGKILVAAQGGKPVPADALVGPDGTITGDPAVLYGDTRDSPFPDPKQGPGAIRAFGEHKGSGLALACDLLAGALGGSRMTRSVGERFHNGMLSIYLDPGRFDTAGTWAADAAAYVDWIRSCAPIDPGAPVLVPGDKERASEAERSRDGLPFTDATWAAIRAAGSRVGLTDATIDALTV